jgi:hypothetical protein
MRKGNGGGGTNVVGVGAEAQPVSSNNTATNLRILPLLTLSVLPQEAVLQPVLPLPSASLPLAYLRLEGPSE